MVFGGNLLLFNSDYQGLTFSVNARAKSASHGPFNIDEARPTIFLFHSRDISFLAVNSVLLCSLIYAAVK